MHTALIVISTLLVLVHSSMTIGPFIPNATVTAANYQANIAYVLDDTITRDRTNGQFEALNYSWFHYTLPKPKLSVPQPLPGMENVVDANMVFTKGILFDPNDPTLAFGVFSYSSNGGYDMSSLVPWNITEDGGITVQDGVEFPLLGVDYGGVMYTQPPLQVSVQGSFSYYVFDIRPKGIGSSFWKNVGGGRWPFHSASIGMFVQDPKGQVVVGVSPESVYYAFVSPKISQPVLLKSFGENANMLGSAVSNNFIFVNNWTAVTVFTRPTLTSEAKEVTVITMDYVAISIYEVEDKLIVLSGGEMWAEQPMRLSIYSTQSWKEIEKVELACPQGCPLPSVHSAALNIDVLNHVIMVSVYQPPAFKGVQIVRY
jgi:hypothetical protein